MMQVQSTIKAIKKRWYNLPQAYRFGTIVFLVTRFIYSMWAIIILSIIPANPERAQPAVIRNAFEQWFFASWYRWDADWFLKIAQEGYRVADGRSGYYPLYPTLTRIVGDTLGHNYLLSGLIVSNIATWISLILIYILAHKHFNNHFLARKTVIAFALYPFYIFNIIYYADSLVVLFSLATFYAMETKRWHWVGLFSSLAVLSKLPGLVLLAPIFIEFVLQKRRFFSKDIFALLAIPLTIGIWTVVLRFIGSEVAVTDFSSPFSIFTPFLTPSYQDTFKADMVWPWQGLILGFKAIPLLWGQVLVFKVILDVFIVLVFTLAVPFTLKLPRKSYFVYALGLYVMNMTVVVEHFPLANFPRRQLVAFPVFMIFGLAMRYTWGNRIIVTLGLFLSTIISAFLLWWVWVG